MKPSKAVIVEVQHCQNCHLHAWCSRHDENKYIQHKERIRSHALNVFQHCDFRVNQPQNSYENINEPTSKGETKYFDHEAKTIVNFPRFGSFEIFVNGSLVFSKLQSNLWPKHDRIAVLFEKIRQEIESNNTMQKYSLQYRLKNDEDQFFRQTYKKAIERNRRPSLSRPLSQNHSQVLTHGNRSPSNAMKHGNHNFISRKVHQSLKKNTNSQLMDKQQFFKPYRGETRPVTKGLKRPHTNILSRVIKNPAIQFNKQQENFEFDSNEIKNDDEIIAKVVPNPRRRLHILKDSISKQQGTSSNHGQFSSNKQPLSLKTRGRNATNDHESADTKKIGTGLKLPSQSHQSGVIQKNNNWTPTPIGLTPINDISKKQPNEKPFKRVILKSDPKLKLGGSDTKGGRISKAEDSEMQRNEQQLIAKLQQQDSKQLKSDTIEIFSRKEQQPIKPHESQKNIEINNNNNSFEQKASIELDIMQVSLPQRVPEEKNQNTQKVQQKMYTDEEDYEVEFNNNGDGNGNEEQLPNKDNHSVVRNDVNQPPMKTHAFSSQRKKHKSDDTEYQLPKNELNQPQEQHSQDLIRDVESSEDKQEEALQEEYQEDYNIQQEEQKQPSQKHQSAVQLPVTNEVNNNNNSDEDRKKSTSLEQSLFNRPQINHIHSVEVVKQVSLQHQYFQDDKVGQHQYGSQQLKGWSKTQNEMGYEGYSQLKMAQKQEHEISDQGVSVQNERTTKTLIENIKQDQQGQQEKYYEQEEINEVEQEKYYQPQLEKHQQPQQPLQISQRTKHQQQAQNYSQEFAQQQIEQQQQQRPQSRNSMSHNSQRVKTPLNKSIVRQAQQVSFEKEDDERDFTKKQFHVQDEERKEVQVETKNEEKLLDDENHQHQSQQSLQQNLLNNNSSQPTHTNNHHYQQYEHQLTNLNDQQHQSDNAQEQQQLEDIEESHQSIPIIVSTNQGTSRIIQEEVNEGLQQIYSKQEREREEREEILQNMMDVDGNDQQQQFQQQQQEENYKELKPILQNKPKETQNYQDSQQEEVAVNNQINQQQQLEQKQQQQQQQQQQSTPNLQQSVTDQLQPSHQQANSEQQKNDQQPQVLHTPHVPQEPQDVENHHQEQQPEEHQQHTMLEQQQHVSTVIEKQTSHVYVEDSGDNEIIINQQVNNDDNNTLLGEQNNQSTNNLPQQGQHNGSDIQQAAITLPTNNSIIAHEYMQNLQSSLTGKQDNQPQVIDDNVEEQHNQQLAVQDQQQVEQDCEQVVGQQRQQQQRVGLAHEEMINRKYQQQQHDGEDYQLGQQQHVEKNEVQQIVNQVKAQKLIIDKVEGQSVIQGKQQRVMDVKLQQAVQPKQQQAVQLQKHREQQSQVEHNQQLESQPLQHQSLLMSQQLEQPKEQKAEQPSQQPQATPQHDDHQQQHQQSQSHQTSIINEEQQVPNEEQQLQPLPQQQQHEQQHSQQQQKQQQLQVANDAMMVEQEKAHQHNADQEVVIEQQKKPQMKLQQTLVVDQHHQKEQPVGENKNMQQNQEQHQQQQKEQKEHNVSKQDEQNVITVNKEQQQPIQQVNHQHQNTLHSAQAQQLIIQPPLETHQPQQHQIESPPITSTNQQHQQLQQSHSDQNDIQLEKEQVQPLSQTQQAVLLQDDNGLNKESSTHNNEALVAVEEYQDCHQLPINQVQTQVIIEQPPTNHQAEIEIKSQHFKNNLELSNQHNHHSHETTEKIIRGQIDTLNDKIASDDHQDNNNKSVSLKKLSSPENTQKIIQGEIVPINQKLGEQN